VVERGGRCGNLLVVLWNSVGRRGKAVGNIGCPWNPVGRCGRAVVVLVFLWDSGLRIVWLGGICDVGVVADKVLWSKEKGKVIPHWFVV
jgi:hypothetical protein